MAREAVCWMVDRIHANSLGDPSDTSYPSGHSIAAATTAPGVVLALMPAGRRRQQALGGSVMLAAMTALSRTHLNAHGFPIALVASASEPVSRLWFRPRSMP
jgi:membrane-associated phospholipid phosphatase